ncbi:MAG: M1 family metallopeptidase [Gemmatimonadaceae bacterium]
MRSSRHLTAIAALALIVAAPRSSEAQASGRPVGPQWLNADTSKKTNQSNFRGIEEWPAPNEYRTGSGSPGPKYWQQQVDYVIRTSLDTLEHAITGNERVTYHNNSPEALTYLWFQLDQNVERKDSRAALSSRPLPRRMANVSPAALRDLGIGADEDLGMNITRVQVVNGNARTTAPFYVNGTSMRIDLPSALASGQAVRLEIDWRYKVPEIGRNTQRNARDHVKDGWEYEVAQWYPRAAVFDDVGGWTNDQFYSQGEFYQEFGNFDVSITVPRDHIVRATGVLQNPGDVLTATQRGRLVQAMASSEPVFIVRPDEVGNPSTRPAGQGNLTWHFVANNVRDFAWASSHTFVWDAMGFRYKPGGRLIELHSVYPRDGMPLWDKYSTKAIRQTMVTYGRMAMEYPYPVASNVHGSVGGMEYPMIAFCGARPRPDGTYDASLPYRLISVTIHEVGHNWFPMILATDERKWGWMDEGMNSFLQYYAEHDWDPNYPSRRGPAKNIVEYFKDPNQAPMMTESDVVFANYGNQAYSKPAATLVMLREQVLGPESFDRAFHDYAQQWAFKKPQPADFFRTLVNSAGEQLNWFWRGMFYTTYANDQAIGGVDTQKAEELAGDQRRGEQYHRITLQQKAGLIMPIQMEITYEDGSKELVKLPADVWRNNEREFTYGFFSKLRISQVVLDPNEVFADINRENNTWKAPANVVP